MAGIISLGAATGQSGLYYQAISLTTGQAANGTTMEAYNQAHWGNYVISAAEQAGSGRYVAGIPGYFPADKYLFTLYTPLTGSPASGDTGVGERVIDWDGANILGIGSPVNVTKINGSALAATNLAISASAFGVGVTTGGVLTVSQMTTNLTAPVANTYNGRVLYFTSGVNQGRAAIITSYIVSGGRLTFVAYNNQPLSTPPGVGDSFIIL